MVKGNSIRNGQDIPKIMNRITIPKSKCPMSRPDPVTSILPALAKALGVSSDQLMGIAKVKGNGKVRDTRLWRRFSQVEKLPPLKRKQITVLLDAFLKSEKATTAK